MCLTKSTRVRQLIVKQTGCLPFVQVAPKCLPFAQNTTKQRYLSRKATMGIFGLFERSYIKRYWINQMLYWLHVCICLQLLVWNAGRSHVKKIPSAKNLGGEKVVTLAIQIWECFILILTLTVLRTKIFSRHKTYSIHTIETILAIET